MKKYLGWAFLLASCASISKVDSVKPTASTEIVRRREMLVGKWYSESPTKNQELRKTLMLRKLDGTYLVQFQIFKNQKKVYEQSEAGFWGYSGDVYFTIARELVQGTQRQPFDMTNQDYYDAYRILDLEMLSFRYKSLSTGSEYSTNRVFDNFTLL